MGETVESIHQEVERLRSEATEALSAAGDAAAADDKTDVCNLVTFKGNGKLPRAHVNAGSDLDDLGRRHA